MSAHRISIEEYLDDFTPMDDIPTVRPVVPMQDRPGVVIGGVEYVNFGNTGDSHSQYINKSGADEDATTRAIDRVLVESGLLALAEDGGATNGDGETIKKNVKVYKHPEVYAYSTNSVRSKIYELIGGEDLSHTSGGHTFHPPTHVTVTVEQAREALDRALLDAQYDKEAAIVKANRERVKETARVKGEGITDSPI